MQRQQPTLCYITRGYKNCRRIWPRHCWYQIQYFACSIRMKKSWTQLALWKLSSIPLYRSRSI